MRSGKLGGHEVRLGWLRQFRFNEARRAGKFAGHEVRLGWSR